MSVDIGEENVGGEADNHMGDNRYLAPFIDSAYVNPLTKDKPATPAKQDKVKLNEEPSGESAGASLSARNNQLGICNSHDHGQRQKKRLQ